MSGSALTNPWAVGDSVADLPQIEMSVAIAAFEVRDDGSVVAMRLRHSLTQASVVVRPVGAVRPKKRVAHGQICDTQ